MLLVTYNHASFVRRALSSIAMQDYGGDVEIIVADDASTDQTLNIIRGFGREEPRFGLRYLSSSKNVGITRNYARGFEACTGQYVAVLEGDDFWIDRRKLSSQVAFLEANRECSVSATNYYIFDEATASATLRTVHSDGLRYLSVRDLIHDNVIGNFSTCMYRASALREIPGSVFEGVAYDWIVNLTLARKGQVGFLGSPMSVYRLHSGGTWSGSTALEKLRLQLQLIPEYNALLDNAYTREFSALAKRLRRQISIEQGIGPWFRFHQMSTGLRQTLKRWLPAPVLAFLRATRPGAPMRLSRPLPMSGDPTDEGMSN